MTVPATLALLAIVLATATLSGVFGMAGGLILMGALAFLMPVQAAMVTHGAVQIASNGWRAAIHRRHVKPRILALYALGSLAAGLALTLAAYAPSRAWVFLLLGLVPALVWLPKGWLEADAAKPGHAFLCGLSVTGLNIAAGVAGPLLDVFFVRTALTRHEIVATKAATQVLAHLGKVVFYGAPLFVGGLPGMPPAWFFAAMIPLALAGGAIGARILDSMSDKSFLNWTKWIVSAVGLVYLARAFQEFAA